MSVQIAGTLAITSALCVACAIGSPLVDDKPDFDSHIGRLECHTPPMCEPLPFTEPKRPPDQVLYLGPCGSESIESLPLTVACSRLTMHASAQTMPLELEGVRWSMMDLSIEAAEPVTITVRSAELRTVAVHLRGPISLAFEDTQLTDLQLDGAASTAGSPQLTLLRVTAQRLHLGTRDRILDGTVKARASVLSDIDIQVQTLETESVKLEQGFVHAQTLSVVDTSLLNLELAAQHAVLSEFDANQTRIQLCGYASLIGGRLNRSLVQGCLESAMRVYASFFGSCALTGSFEADDSDFENSSFGIDADTRILSFQGSFDAVALCEHARQLALNPSSLIKCSSCADVFAQEQRACRLPAPPEAANPVGGNFCPVLLAKTILPVCDPAPPQRERHR